jgi:hypothetical protein
LPETKHLDKESAKNLPKFYRMLLPDSLMISHQRFLAINPIPRPGLASGTMSFYKRL